MHENEVWVGTPTRPWGSRRLPRTLHAGDPRRTLFRTLLRRAEGVEVTFADGRTGVVDRVVLSPIGFDFWPEALVVAMPDGRRRVPAGSVRRIDLRESRLWLEPVSSELLEGRDGGRHERHRHEHHLRRVQPRQQPGTSRRAGRSTRRSTRS
jgi:hypothetical protein